MQEICIVQCILHTVGEGLDPPLRTKIDIIEHVRTGETLDAVLVDFCGRFSGFGEIEVEKCKEKLKIMLDFLLG